MGNNIQIKKPCSYCKSETLEDSNGCKYCLEMDGDNSDSMNLSENCKYCNNMDQESVEECPYCLAAESKKVGTGCPYCVEMQNPEPECQYCANIPTIKLPTTDSQDFAGQGMNEPIIPKPVLGENGPIGITTPVSYEQTTNNRLIDEGGPTIIGVSNAPETVHDNGEESLLNIAAQIEAAPSRSVSVIDPTELPVGNSVEGNVSRPTTYDQDQDSDMGTPGSDNLDQPDLTDVLHEGLDNYADNIQRERVVQMISEALAGFKAQKNILDKAQMEAPMFHASCVNMLKVMIEMAKMLGFGADEQLQEQVQPVQHTNVWSQPFPTHPDNGGNQDGQAAGTGSAESLPTTTSQHVAKQPIPIGSTNANGQMRYLDPETQRESFINMKEGRVLSPTGKPVKPY